MTKALNPRLARLWAMGNRAGYPVTEPLGDGLFELRGRCQKVRMRLLFGFLPGQRIVFVWGTIKKTRTLSPADLKMARELLVEATTMQETLDAVKSS
jgi:hypothetical protein